MNEHRSYTVQDEDDEDGVMAEMCKGPSAKNESADIFEFYGNNPYQTTFSDMVYRRE